MIADPNRLVGKEVKAADGGDYGNRILSYNAESNDYTVQQIRWSDGEKIKDHTHRIDANKLSYRYNLFSARDWELGRVCPSEKTNSFSSSNTK